MTAIEAAYQVLRDAGKPMHYRKITELVLERGLWETDGQTPWATLNARLAVDIKNHQEESRFLRVDPGVFSLREWDRTDDPDGDLISTEREGDEPARTGARRPEGFLSFIDAAEQVLQMFGRGEPMHYRAITDLAQEHGWLYTRGKTPEATMYSQIITDITRREERGEPPRFLKLGGGLLGLHRWTRPGVESQIDRHNRQIRQRLHEWLMDLTPRDFETLIGRLLNALGFEPESIEITTISNDGGIDVRGILVVGDVIRSRMAVQAKRWKSNVPAPVVQQVRGSLGTHEHGLIITTSDFSSGAYQEARRPDAVPVGLMNGKTLIDLLVQHQIGVKRDSRYLLAADTTGVPAEE